MRQMFSDQKGFSLLEVLIAISIMAIGLLALCQMQIKAIQGNAFSGKTTDATTLAQDTLERLMTLDYTDADLTAGSHPPGSQAQISGTQQVANVTYTISWGVTVDSPIDDTKTVDITVTWPDESRQRTLSMQFIKSEVPSL